MNIAEPSTCKESPTEVTAPRTASTARITPYMAPIATETKASKIKPTKLTAPLTPKTAQDNMMTNQKIKQRFTGQSTKLKQSPRASTTRSQTGIRHCVLCTQ